MMTTHCIALARELKATRPAPHWDANKRVQWDMDVRAVARCIIAKREEFFAACGGLFEEC